MVSVDDVARMALALPEVVEEDRHDRRGWSVANKGFAWERAFSKTDLKRFGDEPPPGGPILAVRVEDLGEKEAVLAAGLTGFFTIAHFNNFPAVLVHLDVADEKTVQEAIVDAWLSCAPADLAEAYLHP
jgi:hypothetical protein